MGHRTSGASDSPGGASYPLMVHKWLVWSSAGLRSAALGCQKTSSGVPEHPGQNSGCRRVGSAPVHCGARRVGTGFVQKSSQA